MGRIWDRSGRHERPKAAPVRFDQGQASFRQAHQGCGDLRTGAFHCQQLSAAALAEAAATIKMRAADESRASDCPVIPHMIIARIAGSARGIAGSLSGAARAALATI